MVKAILIDFNGVMIDDEPVQMRAYREVLGERGVELTEDRYYSCLGMSDEVFVRTVCGDDEMPEETVSEIMEAKTKGWRLVLEDGIPLFEGMRDFTIRMSRSFELGVVSMARRTEIDHVLGSTGLGECFSVIISAEDISTTKPDPECYREGFRRIDAVHTAKSGHPITRSECVVIEDSPPGVVAGKQAGLRTLGVTNTVDERMLREAGADSVTDLLSDWNAESFRGVFA